MCKLNSKIKFTAASIAWTEGGIMFDVKASAGSAILIDWGEEGNNIDEATKIQIRELIAENIYEQSII